MVNSMIHTQKYRLNDWIFYSPSKQRISVQSPMLILMTRLDSILQCRLVFNVDWNCYQIIKKKQLFYLETDMMKFYERDSLEPDKPVTISTLFALPILPDADEYYWPSANVSELLNYLERLVKNNRESTLLLTENWLALSVEQQTDNKKVQYRTVWDYLNWNEINRDENEEGLKKWLFPAIFSFLKDAMLNSLNVEKNTGGLKDDVLAISKVLIGSIFDNIPQKIIDYASDNSKIDLKAQVASFLIAEGYVFSQDEDGSAFWLKIQGINGEWICHINVRQQENQVLIYSILPKPVSKKQDLNVFQFICELNYGLAIGNFELATEDGEILFKTSIDFEGSNFEVSLFKQLLTMNLQTVDHYLLKIYSFLNKT
jgi:hypothetical protein